MLKKALNRSKLESSRSPNLAKYYGGVEAAREQYPLILTIFF